MPPQSSNQGKKTPPRTSHTANKTSPQSPHLTAPQLKKAPSTFACSRRLPVATPTHNSFKVTRTGASIHRSPTSPCIGSPKKVGSPQASSISPPQSSLAGPKSAFQEFADMNSCFPPRPREPVQLEPVIDREVRRKMLRQLVVEAYRYQVSKADSRPKGYQPPEGHYNVAASRQALKDVLDDVNKLLSPLQSKDLYTYTVGELAMLKLWA